MLSSSDQPPISVSPPPSAPTPAIAAVDGGVRGELFICAPAPRSNWGFGSGEGRNELLGKMVWARFFAPCTVGLLCVAFE